jgi:hypothetical protein
MTISRGRSATLKQDEPRFQGAFAPVLPARLRGRTSAHCLEAARLLRFTSAANEAPST